MLEKVQIKEIIKFFVMACLCTFTVQYMSWIRIRILNLSIRIQIQLYYTIPDPRIRIRIIGFIY